MRSAVAKCKMRPKHTSTCSGTVLGCHEALVRTLPCISPDVVEESPAGFGVQLAGGLSDFDGSPSPEAQSPPGGHSSILASAKRRCVSMANWLQVATECDRRYAWVLNIRVSGALQSARGGVTWRMYAKWCVYSRSLRKEPPLTFLSRTSCRGRLLANTWMITLFSSPEPVTALRPSPPQTASQNSNGHWLNMVLFPSS